jgi:hypothetical protein
MRTLVLAKARQPVTLAAEFDRGSISHREGPRMVLSYIALAILIIMIIVLVYAFIWVHDIPYMMAKKRNHPNLHAIHIACWLSLFTLHALWPFVFIWAIAQKPRLEVIVVEADGSGGGHGLSSDARKSLDSADATTLRRAVAELQQRLDKLEGRSSAGGAA